MKRLYWRIRWNMEWKRDVEGFRAVASSSIRSGSGYILPKLCVCGSW